MTVAICLDDQNGMLFHSRRQSRDSELIKNLLSYSGGRRVRIHPFSKLLFEEYGGRVEVSEHFLEQAEKDDLCFVEHMDVGSYLNSADTLLIYRWNRTYPSDVKWSLPLTGFRLKERTEFPGRSHDTITREEYVRCSE